MDFKRELEMKLKAGNPPSAKGPLSRVSDGTTMTCLVNVTKDRAKGPKGRRLPQRKSMPAKSSAEDDPNQQMTDLCCPNTSSTAEENTCSRVRKESERISLPVEVTEHKKDVDTSSSSFDNVQQSPGDTDNGDIPEPTRVRPKLGVSLFGQNAALTKELEMKLKAGKVPAARKPPPARPSSFSSPHTNGTAEEKTNSKANNESKRISLPTAETDREKGVDICSQRSNATFQTVLQSAADNENEDIPKSRRMDPKQEVSLLGQRTDHNKEPEKKPKPEKSSVVSKPPPPPRPSSLSNLNTKGSVQENSSLKVNNESKRISSTTANLSALISTNLPALAETNPKKGVDVSNQRSSPIFQTVLQSPGDTENEDIPKPRKLDPKQEVSLLRQHADLNKEPEKKPNLEKSSVVNKPPTRSNSLSALLTKGSVEENTSSKADNESKGISVSKDETDHKKDVDVSNQRSSAALQTVQQSVGDSKNNNIPKSKSVDSKQEASLLGQYAAIIETEKKPKSEVSSGVSGPPPLSGIMKSKYSCVGMRVVRGPDWKWENQDGGEGSVGTVVENGKSDNSPMTLVVVQWDNGIRKKYRVGLNGAYDLRILDNAPLGVRHRYVTCVSCQKESIFGIRWKCKECDDYDLCTSCYMAGQHDITHQFIRFLTPDSTGSTGTAVPERDVSLRIQMKGIFPSAKVVRGPDWNWHDQDGGAGEIGRVIAVRQWDIYSDRNAVTVEWSATGKSYMYRLGQKGKIDVKCVQAAADGFYYKDHLPILGDEIRDVKVEETSNSITDRHKSNNESTLGNREADVNVEDRVLKVSALTTQGIMHLSGNFKDLFSKEKFCDLKIKVGDRTFQVHKGILASRSPYFASNLREHDHTFEVNDCDPYVFKDFLQYVYTGEIENTSIETVVDLSETADKFADKVLKDECLRILKKFFAVRNFCDSIAAA